LVARNCIGISDRPWGVRRRYPGNRIGRGGKALGGIGFEFLSASWGISVPCGMEIAVAQDHLNNAAQASH